MSYSFNSISFNPSFLKIKVLSMNENCILTGNRRFVTSDFPDRKFCNKSKWNSRINVPEFFRCRPEKNQLSKIGTRTSPTFILGFSCPVIQLQSSISQCNFYSVQTLQEMSCCLGLDLVILFSFAPFRQRLLVLNYETSGAEISIHLTNCFCLQLRDIVLTVAVVGMGSLIDWFGVMDVNFKNVSLVLRA